MCFVLCVYICIQRLEGEGGGGGALMMSTANSAGGGGDAKSNAIDITNSSEVGHDGRVNVDDDDDDA